MIARIGVCYLLFTELFIDVTGTIVEFK